MARETKVGLLVGMAVILLIGIIVSDHLSAVQGSNPANMTNWAHRAQDSVTDRPRAEQYAGDAAPMAASNRASTPTAPILRADELNQPKPRPTPPPAQLPQAIGDGDAPLASNTVAQQQQQSMVLAIHTVHQGETLGNIARQYYGNVEGWKAIQFANLASLGRGGTGMREGTKLLIPRWTPSSDPGPSYDAQPVAQQPQPQPQPVPQQPIAQQPRETEADQGGLFAPVADPRRAPGASEGTMLKVVEVQQGQTLSMIAGKHLGDKARWKDILDANKDVITSPTQLKTGMKLKIPGTQATSGHPTTPAPSSMLSPTPASSVGGSSPSTPSTTDSRPGVPWPTAGGSAPIPVAQKTHTVQMGDTLSSIALKHLGDKAKWKDILAVNKGTIDSANDLHVGQVLMLPASSGR